MTFPARAPPPGGEGGALECQLLANVDVQDINQNRPNTQAQIPRNPRAVHEAKLELLREAVHEACGFIQIHANVCQDLAEAGDDAGLIHSLGRLILYTKHAARHGNDLREIRAEGASNKEGAP